MRTKYKSNLPSKSIKEIVAERLRLQSTQRALERQFGLFIPSVIYLESLGDAFKSLTEDKQRDFITILGGQVNYNKTLSFFNDLTKNDSVIA